jgi:KaiC/GvpD/RAD55 family RecA-like ATPase
VAAFEQVDSVLREKVLSVQRTSADDEGMDYLNTVDERYSRLLQEAKQKERFATGFPTIDNNINGQGLSRGEIASIVGASGVGKSLFLTAISAAALRQDKNVLYVTLELRQDKVGLRFDAILTGIPYHELLGRSTDVAKQLKTERFPGWLEIKEFPAGAADVATIERHIEQMRNAGKVPDVVVVDYVGEMRHNPDVPKYESRVQIVRDLRGLATRFNFVAFTAMQCNRQGKAISQDGVIDESHFGQSYEQLQPLDACWSMNQNEADRLAKTFRIHYIKHRDGSAFADCHARLDAETLQIGEITPIDYKRRLSLGDRPPKHSWEQLATPFDSGKA